MANLSDMASFAVVAALVTIIPGLDTALVVRTTVTQGRRRGFAAAFGINTGVLAWGAAAAVGVSALLAASQLGYTVIRAAGAAYLIWLGTTMLWRTRRRRNAARLGTARSDATNGQPESPRPAESVFRSWLRGATANLLNPKIGAFYVAILPQFIPPTPLTCSWDWPWRGSMTPRASSGSPC